MVQLTHYSDREVILDRTRDYQQGEESPGGHFKPCGLWVSVDGPDDWPEWCRDNEFRVDMLAVAHRVRLAPEARLTVITSPKLLNAFHAIYSHDTEYTRHMETHYPARNYGLGDDFLYRQLPIDWARVAAEYDGIVIAPYLWDLRLFGPSWYSTWDCASGCIWNLSAIESFGEQMSKSVNDAERPGRGYPVLGIPQESAKIGSDEGKS